MPEELPAVTCLCPTYGRFERLRDAVACFLLQDYPNKRLHILSDAPIPLSSLSSSSVVVENSHKRFRTLGEKRQRLLELADTPLVAHWDDDDLYLPWHLSHCVAAISNQHSAFSKNDVADGRPLIADRSIAMVKPRGAWWMLGHYSSLKPQASSLSVRGPCHNVFEGQAVFGREEALRLGGYPPKVSGQAKALINKFHKAGKFLKFDPWPFISYVYRWGDGLHHISGGGDNAQNWQRHAERDTDFGGGRPVIPLPPGEGKGEGGDSWPITWARDRLRPLFDRLLAGIEELVSEDEHAAIERRLRGHFQ